MPWLEGCFGVRPREAAVVTWSPLRVDTGVPGADTGLNLHKMGVEVEGCWGPPCSCVVIEFLFLIGYRYLPLTQIHYIFHSIKLKISLNQENRHRTLNIWGSGEVTDHTAKPSISQSIAAEDNSVIHDESLIWHPWHHFCSWKKSEKLRPMTQIVCLNNN